MVTISPGETKTVYPDTANYSQTYTEDATNPGSLIANGFAITSAAAEDEAEADVHAGFAAPSPEAHAGFGHGVVIDGDPGGMDLEITYKGEWSLRATALGGATAAADVVTFAKPAAEPLSSDPYHRYVPNGDIDVGYIEMGLPLSGTFNQKQTIYTPSDGEEYHVGVAIFVTASAFNLFGFIPSAVGGVDARGDPATEEDDDDGVQFDSIKFEWS